MYMRCHEKGATFAAPDLLERVPVKRYSSIFAAFPSNATMCIPVLARSTA